MNKNGFTIIELLAVIALLAIITTIAVPAILGIQNNIQEKSLKTKFSVIEESAIMYGQDNKSEIIESENSDDNGNKYIVIKVSDLVSKYLDADIEFGINGCNKENGCVVNPNNKNIFLDDYNIEIIYKNKRIYATMNK